MNIGVVLVTYNRLEKLKTALELYDSQSFLPKYILIVNNNSNDGTREYLETWLNNKKDYRKIVFHLETNIGGSGGFNYGLKEASKLDSDWIWVSDDDAFPELNAFENINTFYQKFNNKKDLVSICGQVLNNGSPDVNHRRYIKKGLFNIKQNKSNLEDYLKPYFFIDLFSYVGTLIRKDILLDIGYPKKDYFIYYDDTEHSYRLSLKGKIVCVPNVIIHHDTGNNNTIDWKLYYNIRNKLDFIKNHFKKRYYIYNIGLIKTKDWARRLTRCGYDEIISDIKQSAIRDSKNNKFGLHSVYKPGWKYHKR